MGFVRRRAPLNSCALGRDTRNVPFDGIKRSEGRRRYGNGEVIVAGLIKINARVKNNDQIRTIHFACSCSRPHWMRVATEWPDFPRFSSRNEWRRPTGASGKCPSGIQAESDPCNDRAEDRCRSKGLA